MAKHLLSIPIGATFPGDSPIFVATSPCYVEKIKESHSVVGSTSASLQVMKCAGGTVAPESGIPLHATVIDLTVTAPVAQTATLVANAATRTLAAGDVLSLDLDGTLTGLVGVLTIELSMGEPIS